MSKTLLRNNQKHGYHLVDVSPWPFFAAFAAFFVTFGLAMYMHGYGASLFTTGLVLILMIMFTWWRDVVREATYEGQHTFIVQKGIRLGMILFIVSEVMFFFGFFWAFFHSSINPNIEIGSVWPPVAIEILNPWHIPLLNTILLVSSGFTITWAHFAIISGSKEQASIALLATIGLAVIFTLCQAYEYKSANFTLSSLVYGSSFYMTTGLHGFHVIVGTIFLTVCFFRLYNNHFTKEQHVGFEMAAWYWHFVDVVWLFLFISIYWWGS